MFWTMLLSDGMPGPRLSGRQKFSEAGLEKPARQELTPCDTDQAALFLRKDRGLSRPSPRTIFAVLIRGARMWEHVTAMFIGA